MLNIAVSTLSDKGAAPTETENLIKQLLNAVNGELQNGNNINLNIDISPRYTQKLNTATIEFIKKQEERYTKKDSAKKLNRYDYYVLTLRALQKLRYVDDSGKPISQPVFSTALGLRRSTIWEHTKTIDSEKYSTEYLDIERALFLRSE